MTDPDRLRSIARELRRKVVEMAHAAKAGHLASCLSAADIVAATYFGDVLRLDPRQPTDPDRDRFLLSKGHAAALLYSVLAVKTVIPATLLATYAADGSWLAEHPPTKLLAGIEFAGGSLGHGLGVGVGMALAARLQNRDYRTFVLMSDGETNEGSVWEAAMIAAEHRLDTLCTIIDCNGWQGIGRAKDCLESLRRKFAAFGWCAITADGHDPVELAQTMRNVPYQRINQPFALICKTVKGRGVSFMEDENLWHYRSPDSDELARALTELQ